MQQLGTCKLSWGEGVRDMLSIRASRITRNASKILNYGKN